MEDIFESGAREESAEELIDEAMLNMGEFLSQMTDVDGYLRDTGMLTAMQLEKVNLSMPIQLDLQMKNDGSLALGGSPPLYYAETTFLPVFHQLTVNIKVEEKENLQSDGWSK